MSSKSGPPGWELEGAPAPSTGTRGNAVRIGIAPEARSTGIAHVHAARTRCTSTPTRTRAVFRARRAEDVFARENEEEARQAEHLDEEGQRAPPAVVVGVAVRAASLDMGAVTFSQSVLHRRKDSVADEWVLRDIDFGILRGDRRPSRDDARAGARDRGTAPCDRHASRFDTRVGRVDRHAGRDDSRVVHG